MPQPTSWMMLPHSFSQAVATRSACTKLRQSLSLGGGLALAGDASSAKTSMDCGSLAKRRRWRGCCWVASSWVNSQRTPNTAMRASGRLSRALELVPVDRWGGMYCWQRMARDRAPHALVVRVSNNATIHARSRSLAACCRLLSMNALLDFASDRVADAGDVASAMRVIATDQLHWLTC